ncbi:MAG: CDP-diacylglycerol--glycerol-3-phosphate 3-phosphatidyltransferase [Gammaproteobacteria bacterium]|nr:CDP-diacylglycerol--glycerol-3-phosphate 3-phosphatidyltransferase [Gammaproteobacteria bacterium]MDH5654170.1 CDP-diacylglycerol--glycerol-3-phosphate 3-phosphatidyltransferase [Gammaproteobacteria bacterium]
MKWNIPNILTLLRIVLIPVFVVAFYLPEFGWNNVLITAIFFLAGISDWFDGYLARKLDQQSAFGAFLDPVADKLMVATALVLLVGADPRAYMAVPAAVIIGREIAVSALREWMANIGDQTKVKVSMIGKIKTALQMLAIGSLLYKEPVGFFPTSDVGYVLLYMAAVLTLWSMVIYLQASWASLTRDA